MGRRNKFGHYHKGFNTLPSKAIVSMLYSHPHGYYATALMAELRRRNYTPTAKEAEYFALTLPGTRA
jgi:hypothetical protein